MKIVASVLMPVTTALLLWNNVAYARTFRNSIERTRREPATSKKWIVVTSSDQTGAYLKSLVKKQDWQLVVVGDVDTRKSWQLEGVHFLGLDVQQSLRYKVMEILPNNPYTRKNIAYLYAIEHGAEWILDAGDYTDLARFFLGFDLTQFDYTERVSGLRYGCSNSRKRLSSAQLFNPYEYLGFTHLRPRGFPQEFMEGKTNDPERFCLCHEMRTPSVQHGFVKGDALLLTVTNSSSTSNESSLQEEMKSESRQAFSIFAPPVVLENGFYSPWSSESTLYHKSAFFTLFRPVTLAAGTAEVWRSYIVQKLLHMVGERVGFYPIGANENEHNLTNGWTNERNDSKIGEMIELLDAWECPQGEILMENCTVLLARELSKNNFWGPEDVKAVQLWISDLQSIGYEFPLRYNFSNYIFSTVYERSCGGNCRRASMQFGPEPYSKIDRSYLKLRGFGELASWCAESGFTDLLQSLPSAPQLSATHAESKVLTGLTETVLVITSNYAWNETIGLLQRLYQPYFGTTIFCGPWFPEHYSENKTFPKMLRSFNYIHTELEEMRNGWFAYYCLAKVKELRLRNVRGYFVMADDTTFNFWNEVDLDTVLHPMGHTHASEEGWWNDPAGKEAATEAVRLFETVYKLDPSVQAIWRQFGSGFRKQNNVNESAADMLTRADGWTVSDFYYIPSSGLDYHAGLMEIFFQAGLFHEIAISKYLYSVPHKTLPTSNFFSLLGQKHDRHGTVATTLIL